MRLVASILIGLFVAASSTAEAAPVDLNDTARFLAGMGVSRRSPLAEHARAQSYVDYAAEVSAGWQQFQEPNLDSMRTWWRGHAPATSSTVFYPFAGPDIGNALVLFPDADTYLLFGLEAPGAIPDLRSMDDDSITAGLTELKSSLSTILQVNYFFTKAMKKKLNNGSFNSITGLLLFFLARSDYEVMTAKKITIARSPGVEITFRRRGGKQQTLRYLTVNVGDADLARSFPDFIPYLASQKRFVTMIKSASYLMHKDGIAEATHFDKIRALILEHSDFVVQDDSGIPLRLFAREAWKLQFHGVYDAPTPEFSKHLQRDLKVEMQRNSTGILPFSYGYAYKQGESNLMTAERAP